MARVVVRSFLILVLSALGGSLVLFVVLRLIGGDIAAVILGDGATPEALATLRADLGLDDPWLTQYQNWLLGIFSGDLGVSVAARFDIGAEIWKRMAVTFPLAIGALVIASVVGLIVGVYSAFHASDWRGSAMDVTSQLGIAIPEFWLGIALASLFAVSLGWFASGGFVAWGDSWIAAVQSLLLPAMAVATPRAAVLTRYVRSSMLEVLSADYIRTAMAKGRTRRSAALHHGVRNASIQLFTVTTLQLGALLAGSVVIEKVFVLPGLGSLVVDAVAKREVLVVQSVVFVILVFILCVNFLMDIMYGVLDPRMRDASNRQAYR